MIFVKICVGSSCHLKGSEKLVGLFTEKIRAERLEEEIILTGSFCLGKCNRIGVTVAIGDGDTDEVFVGITPEGFETFWKDTVLVKLKESMV